MSLGGDLCYDSWSLGHLGYLYPGTTPVMIKLDKKTRQNGRKMTSFREATAKLGACVDNELGGLAPHQCR